MRSNDMNQTLVNIFFILASAACIFPFLLLFIASFSSEQSIIANGYSLFPSEFSLEAYKYLWSNFDSIGRSYGITVLITAVGTSAGLFISLQPKLSWRI